MKLRFQEHIDKQELKVAQQLHEGKRRSQKNQTSFVVLFVGMSIPVSFSIRNGTLGIVSDSA